MACFTSRFEYSMRDPFSQGSYAKNIVKQFESN